MPEATINLLETIADVLIVVLSGWAGLLFYRNYRRGSGKKAAFLTAVFTLITLFKLTQLALGTLLDLPAFAWMDTNLATEALVVVFAGANIYAISGGSGWRGSRLARKPGVEASEKKDRAA